MHRSAGGGFGRMPARRAVALLLGTLLAACADDPAEPANDAPQACFAVDPAQGDSETLFVLDAACSADAEDELAELRFEWDWQGDGAADSSLLGEPLVEHRFAAGQHRVVLRVVDSLAGEDRDTLELSVAAHVPPPGTFIAVPAGSFMMGSLDGAPGTISAEYPRHEVTLSRGFRIQSTEVTNAQYLEMMQWAIAHGHATLGASALRDALDGSTVELLDMDSPYCEIADNGLELATAKPSYPVRAVSWYGAAAYCDWLSLREHLPRAYDHADWSCGDGEPYAAAGYRLPTEAEWEYACRAGTQTSFAGGMITQPTCSPPDPVLAAMGWYCANAGGNSHPVAQKQANAWGLADMHGNLAEWCGDWYASDYYETSPAQDPPGPATGLDRLRRGGVFFDSAQHCQSGTRRSASPAAGSFAIGFRPLRGEP